MWRTNFTNFTRSILEYLDPFIRFTLNYWNVHFLNCFLLHHQVYRLLFTEIYKLSLFFVFCFRLVIFVNQSWWRNIKSLGCNFTNRYSNDRQSNHFDRYIRSVSKYISPIYSSLSFLKDCREGVFCASTFSNTALVFWKISLELLICQNTNGLLFQTDMVSWWLVWSWP